MTDLLSAFLLKAANDCIGDEVFVLEEEPECEPVLCRACNAKLVEGEWEEDDDRDYCGEDCCQPCCATDGRFYGYSRTSPCPDCAWCLRHPEEAARL